MMDELVTPIRTGKRGEERIAFAKMRVLFGFTQTRQPDEKKRKKKKENRKSSES